MAGEPHLASSLVQVFGSHAEKMAQTFVVHQAWIGNQAGVERWRRVVALIAASERQAGARGQDACKGA
ncbi:MAG: hypothetical protein BGN85_03075 [Alphaproteobacteria bacterium 64-11]|nr:hypothetical protein [Alphaproteobacteria bacterium]OJU07596.1 MAG: hypothetical protein BGN85_03075 [Alphaproteobacteria bacterium 64-11]